ncbi:MAG: hypothetical protein QOF13_2439 [Solirubrobacterales bacterium]|nr:hypothetical protein [Solirubrobacterales bacterium]
MIRAIVVAVAMMAPVMSTVVVMVNLAVGVLLVLPRRVIGTVLGLSDAPTAKGQGTGNSQQSGYACGSLDHRCSFLVCRPRMRQERRPDNWTLVLRPAENAG